MDECEKELAAGMGITAWLLRWETESLDRLWGAFKRVYPERRMLWQNSLDYYFEVKRPKNA